MNLNDPKFISVAKLRNFAPIGSNFDQKGINIAVINAQHEFISPAIGTNLYEKLVEDINTNPSDDPGTAFTGDYKVLVESFIQPCLLWSSFIALTYNSLLEVRDNGIVSTNQGANGPAAQRQDVNTRIEIAEDKLLKTLNRLKLYLLDKGSATFPEISESTELYENDPDYGTFDSGPAFYPTSQKITNSGVDAIDDFNQKYS